MGQIKSLYTDWLSRQHPHPLDDGQLSDEEEQRLMFQFAEDILYGQVDPDKPDEADNNANANDKEKSWKPNV